MKKLIIPALFFTLSFSAIANVEIPRISAPVELVSGEFAEGTLTRLSDAEVAEFLPWAQNAQNQLNRAMKQAQSIPLRERLPHIERAVRSVVSRSEGRQYQMFMRYALNRGLLLVDELEKNSDMDEIGAQESALDLLQRSIQIGLSFYESDLNFQRRAQSGHTTTVLENARFAAAFMQGMYPGVINVLDATAQYRLLYKLVEMVNWDLSRDAQAQRYAEVIVEAHEMTVDIPEIPLNDDKANLRLIRRLNSLRIMNVHQTYQDQARLDRFTADQREAEIRRMENERQAQIRREAEEREYERMRLATGRTALQEEDLKIARQSLGSSSWDARRDAIYQLGKIPGDDVALLIINRYSDSDSDVRAAAHNELTKRSINSAEMVRTLIANYERVSSWETRRLIVYQLDRLKNVTVVTNFMITVIRTDSDSDVRAAAYNAMSGRVLDDGYLPGLESLAGVSSWEARRLGVYLIGRIHTMNAYRLLGRIVTNDSDSDVRSAAQSAMNNMRSSLQ
jgi:HEAT repeat protein